MKQFFPFFLILSLLVVWQKGYSSPASSGNLQISQSGNSVDVRLFGDEFLHWYQTSDNYLLGINSSGNFEYMETSSDNLSFTGVELSSIADLSGLTSNDFPSSTFFRNLKSERNEKVISATPLSNSGTINNLVVLVYFDNHVDSGNTIVPHSDHVVSPDDTTVYDDLFNANSNSLSDYFNEMSRGSVTLDSYLTPWIKVSGNEQDYGVDNSGNTDLGISQLYSDVIDAINSANITELPALDGSIQYDMMTIIHSGRNQASLSASTNTSRLWSRWDEVSGIGNITIAGENIQISKIVTTSALGGDGDDITDLGVLCHETSHLFGLPDLYEYREYNFGIGTWGLMGLGAWGYSGNEQDSQNPMPLSAYSLTLTNWVESTLVDVSSANISLSTIESNDELYKFSGNQSEYFLMEYRDFNASSYGNEMSQTASPGALIYHIYSPAFSSLSSNITHPIVRIIEADDNNSLGNGSSLAESGDIWNASSNLNEFSIDSGAGNSHSGLYGSDYSSPDVSVDSYNRIENIRIESGDFVFDYTGQRSSISILDFNNGIIQWEPVEGATLYILEREDDNSGTFNVILAGNATTTFDDPDIEGSVNFRYRVIASRYDGEDEFYSDEFFYGFVVSRVSLIPDTSSLELVFNADVDISSDNIFDLSGMRILDSGGNSIFDLIGSDDSVYSFPGISSSSSIDATFVSDNVTVTDTVNINLSSAQLYEMIQLLENSNNDLLLELDAGVAQMKLDPFLTNSQQLYSDSLAIAISYSTDQTAPNLESATYDDSKGQIILGYSEPIWFTELDLSEFVYSENSESTDLDGVSFSISDNILTITLDYEKKARATLLNYLSGNVTSLAINTAEIVNFTGVGSTHNAASLSFIEDDQAPFIQSFILNNRDENQTVEIFFNESIFFPQGEPSSSSDFELVMLNSVGGDELVNISGNGFTLTTVTDTSITPNITRVDSVVIALLPSEIEDIDTAYGFVNPAPEAYAQVKGEVFSDYIRSLNNLSHEVDTSVSVSSSNYTPKRRARFIHPHYDDETTETDEDEGLIWKSSHQVGWEINGGWSEDDVLRLEWVEGNSSGLVAENFNLDVGTLGLSTKQYQLWDTTSVADNVGYTFYLRRESDSKLYQESVNTVEVDNTQPTVFFSYISNSTPTNKVNAEVTVNPNLHTFPLTSDEEDNANILIVANYDEPMIASPTLTLNQQGSVDIVVTMSPSEGTLPSNVFYYPYDVIEQDTGDYLDGFAQVSLSDERDRARGHLLVTNDDTDETILGNLSEEVDSTTVFFSIDTIPPSISSLEFSITNESIVDEVSELKLKFSESLYKEAGDELITGVLDPGNYFLSGSASNDLEVVSITVDENEEYTLVLDGIVDEGTLVLSIFQENIVDFHNNSFGIPNSASAVWPGPLIHLHEVVLAKGGRTRLLLQGGFTPYEHFIAPLYQSIISLDESDNKTIYGLGEAEESFFIDITEARGQVRTIQGELSDPRVNTISSSFSAYRDELDFKMVSFPFNLSNWDGESLFDLLEDTYGTHGSDYVLYYYNEDNTYASVIETTTEVGPGYGFWMASRRANSATVQSEGPLHEQVVAVDLHEGWNLIGNPFDVEIDLDQIYVSTDATRYTISDVTQSETANRIWYIDLASPQYQSLDTLPPFTAAWLYIENEDGAEVMFFQTPEDENLDIYFPDESSSKSQIRSNPGSLPPLRPASFSNPGTGANSDTNTQSSESGGGGGGGCLLTSRSWK